MKKAILVALVSAGISIVAGAQVTFGVHANGIAASGKMQNKTDNQELNLTLKTRISWKAGLVADLPVSENLSFMPQLNLLSKGGKINDSYNESYEGVDYLIKTKGEAKLTYIELPLNIAYKGNNYFLGAGPSLSYGLGGKAKSSIITSVDGEVVQTIDDNGDVKFDGKKNSYNDLHLKALELGANFMAAYRFTNGVFVQANYNLGLSNIDPDQGSKWKNRYFGIGVGYFFNKN